MTVTLSPAFGKAGRPRQPYCMPTAVASLIGVDPEVVEAAVLAHRATVPAKRKRGQKPDTVVGVWWHEVAPVLARLGWRFSNEARCYQQRGLKQTFAAWQRGRGENPWLVLITGHYVAVAGNEFVDSRNRFPIPLQTAPYRRCRVMAFGRLERIAP